MTSKYQVEVEGSYTGTREYNKDTREFIDSGKIEEKARDAAETSPEEVEKMREAEKEGKCHRKEEDSALKDKS